LKPWSIRLREWGVKKRLAVLRTLSFENLEEVKVRRKSERPLKVSKHSRGSMSEEKRSDLK